MKTPDALPEGTPIGNYVVAEVLGQGGGAITYYCTDTLLGREVALKEHFPQGLYRRSAEGCVVAAAGMEEVFERSVDVFLNEARMVAGLKHPHIVPIHDVLAARGTAYAVLELEEGKLLDAWLTAHAAEPRRIQAVLESLLGVLSYLHERSVFHRDIKPANILVRAGDDPVLLDFGAAHVGDFTGQRTIIGTPQFAAPEQFSTEGELGPWSDLYALGSSFLHGLVAEATADHGDIYHFQGVGNLQRAFLLGAFRHSKMTLGSGGFRIAHSNFHHKIRGFHPRGLGAFFFAGVDLGGHTAFRIISTGASLQLFCAGVVSLQEPTLCGILGACNTMSMFAATV